MRFEPPAEERGLSTFVLSSRICRSLEKRNSYKNNNKTLYITIAPTVCRLNNRPVATEQTVQSHIAYLNKVYAGAKFVFVMDPIQWETNKEHCEVFYETESSSTLRRYSKADKIAVFYARNIYGGSFSIGGYANFSGVVVNASSFGLSDILAHELGHSFGLDHPHACYHGIETSQNCKSAGDQLCDTPPDPGPKGVIGLDYCPDRTRKDGQCVVKRCKLVSCPNDAKPFIKNLMSYYHCGADLTAEQFSTLRCVAFNEQSRRVNEKRPCRNSKGCPSNQTCSQGFCEARPGCQAHSDCPNRQYCKSEQCQELPEGECRRDTDCQSGQNCRSGRCFAPPECRNDSDCPTGQVCQSGSCKPAPLPECQNDSDCPARRYCERKKCKDLPAEACRKTLDCLSDQICKEQRCIPKEPPPCENDSDCSNNQKCYNRKCVNCTPDGQASSSDKNCCSNERNDRAQCCSGRSCCGPQNKSFYNSNGRCVCNADHEWIDPNASRDFRCRPRQAPACKKEFEKASSDEECCSKERNDQAQCCAGKSCCGPKNNSSTQSNGNCECKTGYTWLQPSDTKDFRCKKVTPSCAADGSSANTASQCCSKTLDERGKCCSGNNCCHRANNSQASPSGDCQCMPGFVRSTPKNPSDWRCKSQTNCPNCCTLLHTLTGHTKLVRSVALSQDGKLVISASFDKTLKMWDTSTGRLLRTITGPANAVMSVSIHPNGSEFAAGSYDWSYRRWRIAGTFLSRSKLFAPIRSVLYRPDGRQILTGTERGAYLWGIPSGASAGFAGSESIRSGAFNASGSLLALATKNKAVRLYDPNTRRLLRTLSGHASYVFDVSFRPDGKVLTSCSSTIRRWDTSTGKLLSSYNAHNRGVYAVKYNPRNSALFSAGEDSNINIWSVATGTIVQTLTGHKGAVYTLAFSKDGKILASGSKDSTVKLWSCP